jgi:hypothetical protein
VVKFVAVLPVRILQQGPGHVAMKGAGWVVAGWGMVR